MYLILKLFKNKQIRAAYVGWFVIALFFYYQYILRVFPGVMHEEIRITFKATAEQFGRLGSIYLLGYSLLQIPLGVIVDRIGVKRLAIHSIFICIIGSILFGITNHFLVAQIARFVIGVGSASAFMCAIKFVADHFTPGNRGFLMGATLAMGGLGSLTTSHAIAFLDRAEYLSWQEILLLSAGVGLLVIALIGIFVKPVAVSSFEEVNRKPWRDLIASLKSIIFSRSVLLYSVLAIGLYTPLAALADLWGPAFLKQKYNLSNATAANTTMILYIGLTIGSLVLPWLSEKYNILNEAIIACSFAVMIMFGIILYLPPFESYLLEITLLFLGIFCGAEMMCFTGALFFSKKSQSGEVIGVVNTLNMLGGAVVQWLIGLILDLQWKGVMTKEGIRYYSSYQYEVASSVLMLIIAICCVVSFFLSRVKVRRKIV
jgi:sugar phosphate permease